MVKKSKEKEIKTLVMIGYDTETQTMMPSIIDYDAIGEIYYEGHEIDFVGYLTRLIDDFINEYLERLIKKQEKK